MNPSRLEEAQGLNWGAFLPRALSEAPFSCREGVPAGMLLLMLSRLLAEDESCPCRLASLRMLWGFTNQSQHRHWVLGTRQPSCKRFEMASKYTWDGALLGVSLQVVSQDEVWGIAGMRSALEREKITRENCEEKCPSQLVLHSSYPARNGKLTRTGNMSNKWQVHTLPKRQILSLSCLFSLRY